MFKLRAVCAEGARNGLDLEAWLEDSWDQIEQERLLERERVSNPHLILITLT